ncbi:hypothetical protein DFR33_103375 [Bradymonas sediminis]|nr:hypothetical protein DFR33_103375 [Bradymonas sediminis]
MERLRGAKAPRFCKAVVRDSGQGPADLSMIVISNSGSHAEAWNGADGPARAPGLALGWRTNSQNWMPHKDVTTHEGSPLQPKDRP